jgi:hypothetical protein
MGDLGGRARRAWRKEQEKRNEKQRSLAASKHKWEAEDAQRLAGLLGECIAAWAGRLDLPPYGISGSTTSPAIHCHRGTSNSSCPPHLQEQHSSVTE